MARTGPRSGPGIPARKQEHLEIALAEADPGSAWRDIGLVHDALPEVDLEAVDLTTELFGAQLRAPVVIAGMTGGHAGATEINAILAAAAQRHGLALGLGSQRAALADPSVAPTYAVARERAPQRFLIGNIGAAQLIDQPGQPALTLDDVHRAVDMVAANALAVHLNFLEEVVQPEGDRRSRGCAAAIEAIAAGLDIPVVAKETGAGMSRASAIRLAELGVAGIDVGGSGGTNFASIERVRAERQGDVRGMRLGRTLVGWGISTAVSVVAARATGLPLIATGGIRTGLDAGKALALGARAVGVARPLLAAAEQGAGAVDAWLEAFLEELRAVMLLTGCSRPHELAERPVVIGGQTRLWLDDLGYGGERAR